MIPVAPGVQIPSIGPTTPPCYGEIMSSFRDVNSAGDPVPSEGGTEDHEAEEIEDLAENADELRALVRETVHQELRPLTVLVEAMTRWATAAEAAATQLREQRRWG